ncbi:MAG: MarR family transcriptional regulator [Wenzhouxiangellaceae bacterium]
MNTPLLLERLAALIHQSVRDDAARHGLQPVHVQILGYLARANRYSNFPLAIAEYFGITRGTVSQSIRLLEARGLIRRRRDPQHGRRVKLELTEAGRRVLASGWSRQLETALAADGVDARVLGAELNRLLAALQRQNDQHAFGICHQCVHFLREADGYRCGLTLEPLIEEQTTKICREWTAPDAPVE